MRDELPELDGSTEPTGTWSPTLEVWTNQRQAHRAGGLPDDPRRTPVRLLEVVADNLVQAAVFLVAIGVLLVVFKTLAS